MVLATLEVGTAAEEEGFERSYQDQGSVKVWEEKKSCNNRFLRHLLTASGERNRQDSQREETSKVGEVLLYSATCPLLCCYSDLAGPEAGKHLDAGSATATCCNNKCTSFNLATMTTWIAFHLCSGQWWSIRFCLMWVQRIETAWTGKHITD